MDDRGEWHLNLDCMKDQTMKITAAILLIASSAWAQTNFGTITFTNHYGEVTSNAIVTKIEPGGLVYSVSGGGGRVKFSELPEDVRERFGYDPAKAAETEKAQQQRRLRDAQLLAAQAQAAAKTDSERILFEKASASKIYVAGTVMQKTDDGLLVDSGTFPEKIGEIASHANLNQRTGRKLSDNEKNVWAEWSEFSKLSSQGKLYKGICLLTDSTNIDVADDDYISSPAYPNGTYSYSAVSGGQKTIRKFTCDISKVNP
jgi:hypothetical protein